MFIDFCMYVVAHEIMRNLGSPTKVWIDEVNRLAHKLHNYHAEMDAL
jgi:hypothetical protein